MHSPQCTAEASPAKDSSTGCTPALVNADGVLVSQRTCQAAPHSQITFWESQNHPNASPSPTESDLVIIADLSLQLPGDIGGEHGQELLLHGLVAHDQSSELYSICPVQVPDDGCGFINEFLLFGRGQLH